MKYPQLVSMPSAVSDWFEEQLEARGIDSEVYTRYILSLLHAHTLDVIYPEDDLTFSTLKKDGGRGVVSHKRTRRTDTWWRYAQADAEQIKRSAAVECLMSAAEQSCEIESLVDELCNKLKEVNAEGNNSSSKTNQNVNIFKEPLNSRKISPKELAERYYAAFPPLSNKEEENSYFSSNIHLVAGKWLSPEKEPANLITAKWTRSPKKAKRKPQKQPDNNMKSTFKMGNNRNRFGHKRTHSGRNLTKEMADNIANWEFVYNNNNNNNNNYENEDHCLSPIMAEAFNEDVHMYDGEADDVPIRRMQLWLDNLDSETDDELVKEFNSSKNKRLYERQTRYYSLYPTTIWSTNEGATNNVEINNVVPETAKPSTPKKEMKFIWLLDGDDEKSAIREEYKLRTKREPVKKEYMRSPKLDSQYDINLNETSKAKEMEEMTDAIRTAYRWAFKLLEQDREFIKDNNYKTILRTLRRNPLADFQLCEDSTNYLDTETVDTSLLEERMSRLLNVNYSMDQSAFREYSKSPTFGQDNPFSYRKMNEFTEKKDVQALPSPRQVSVVSSAQLSDEEKQLDPKKYFIPLTGLPLPEDQEVDVYADGTSFNINSKLDEVKYQRSASGSLILETELGEYRKYFEYNSQQSRDDSEGEKNEFRIKFRVKENDKSCQTVENQSENPILNVEEDGIFDLSHLFEDKQESEESETDGRAPAYGEIGQGLLKSKDLNKSDISCEKDEVVWRYATKSTDCNAKHPWPSCKALGWDERTMKVIWGSTEASGTWSAKAPARLNECTAQLKEESKKDAEQLLSHLNNLQLSYSAKNVEDEQKSENKNDEEIKNGEESKNDDGPCEKKRRQSDYTYNTWSYATYLRNGCLVNLPILNVNRSVNS